MKKNKEDFNAGLRKIASRYLSEGNMVEDFNSLDPKNRITVFLRLLPYLLKGEVTNEETNVEFRNSLLQRAGLLLQ